MPLQILQNISPFLNQFFLSPIGVLALAGLIPLLIFYLVRPEPEEKIMPSMMFFQKQESDSKLRNALRTLLRNLVLLLHILIVIGFAAAIANPFIENFQKTDNAVVVVDRSASMQGQRAEIQEFLNGNLGKKNTVILVDDEVNVKSTSASPEKVRDIIGEMRFQQTETDIVSGIQTALNFPGEVIVASDLDQTIDSRNVASKLESIIEKPVITMDTSQKNKWGVTSLKINENATEISITSFLAENKTIKLDINENTRKFTLKPGPNTLEVSHKEGKNTVKLPDDSMQADNSAYFYVPKSGRITIASYGEVNRYFEKSVELIDQTRKTVSVSGTPNIYALHGQDSSINREKIRKDVKAGAAAIVFPDSKAMQEIFNYEVNRKETSGEVEIKSPQKINLGTVNFVNRTINSGKSLSSPSAAVKLYNFGKGKILAFNIDSQEFRENLMYPVFWKNMMLKISENPTSDELNLKTGSTITADNIETPELGKKSGRVELRDTGFYTTQNQVFSANLLSRDESAIENIKYSSSSGVEEKVKTTNSLQNLTIILLLLMIGLELSYLYYRGDI